MVQVRNATGGREAAGAHRELHARRTGRRDDLIGPLQRAIEPLADTFGHVVVAHPVGHHWLGVLATAAGRPDDAVRHLQRAVSRHRSLDLPLMAAESGLALAAAHIAAGDARAAADAAAARSLAAA